MDRSLFGTDGIRGLANVEPITAPTVMRLGSALGEYFFSSKGSRRVIIGKDTRRSGYMIENALTAGLTAVGMNVFLLGPIPTPAVGILTRSMRADLGIMISASHNPFYDNGIKFFGPDGFKLSDEVEAEIESLLLKQPSFVKPELIGSASRIDEVLGRYIEFVKTTVPKNLNLNGIKVVLDCANGAAYRSAPQVLWELGVDVISMGDSPNGFNINLNTGSTHPEQAAERVLQEKAQLGICLDGDADRVILIDENGDIADGDQLIALLASFWKKSGKLAKNSVATTIMSNLGLYNFLAEEGISVHKTAVGDRYVVEAMRKGGFNFGGEQSGHIIMTDFTTTGDGLIAAIQFLSILAETKQDASVLLNVFDQVPQLLKNIKYHNKLNPLETSEVKLAIKEAQNILGNGGEMIVRKSGTESLVRVMAQHHNKILLEEVVSTLIKKIKVV